MPLYLSIIRLDYWVADRVDEIVRSTPIAMLLKYLSKFWRSLEIPLINCQVELKLKWKNHCGLSAVAADASSNKIIFTIKNSKLYVSVVTSSAKNNQKLLKHLSKGFERSV